MSGIFSDLAPPFADLVLVLELALGVGLLVGMFLVRRGFVRVHAFLQSAMVLVNIPVVLLWMVPSYLAHVLPELASDPFEPAYFVPTIMLVIGGIAEALGIFVILVAGTNLIPERLRFRRYKLWMRTVLGLWWSVLLLGISTYYLWYAPGAS